MAATTVANSSLLSGGNYAADNGISWWTVATNPISVTIVPSSVPTAASTTVGTPTTLPATGQSYGVGTLTAGDIAQTFKFSEATSAATSTELEITFTLSTSSVTTTTVYVETQSTAPGTAQTWVFYMDAGSAASASVTINYAEQVSQQCSSVGTCP